MLECRIACFGVICVLTFGLAAAPALAQPLFPNSVVSNDIDFIRADDPAVPGCLRHVGVSLQEMPGALDSDELFVADVQTFAVTFADGSEVGLWVHPDVGSRDRAVEVASLLVGPLGRLPAILRRDLSHVVIQAGDRPAFSEHLGRFFVVYADNVAQRIATHDLEETVFHESVHATLDAEWAVSPAWRAAQAADAGFITDYAAENPDLEDLAESALFAITYLRHPDRLPPEVRDGIERLMPARLALLVDIFAAPEPDLSGAVLPQDCLGPPRASGG